MMNMSKTERAVYETGFALDDVILYLDTHPEDKEALAYYEKVREDYACARKAYVEQVGPLTADDVTCDNHWAWIDRPWPWEGGACGCGPMKNACNTR